MLKFFGHYGTVSGILMILTRCTLVTKVKGKYRESRFKLGTYLATLKVGTTRRLTMRTHILITTFALMISACASYHKERVPASTQAQDQYNSHTPFYNQPERVQNGGGNR